MRRRDVIIGLAGLATVGGAAYTFGASDATGVEPVEIETVAAPGSTAGTALVPERGRVSVVEFFATWCTVCAASMPALRTVHEGLAADVQFVSVTNEPLGHAITRQDVTDWWTEHDGTWLVGLDDDLALTERLDATGVPTLFVLDAENRVTYSHVGEPDAEEVLQQVRAAGATS